MNNVQLTARPVVEKQHEEAKCKESFRGSCWGTAGEESGWEEVYNTAFPRHLSFAHAAFTNFAAAVYFLHLLYIFFDSLIYFNKCV